MDSDERPRWGFQWWKVGSGLTMLLAGGAVSVVAWYAGFVSVWAVGLAVVGVFTIISGLVGEEGVWK